MEEPNFLVDPEELRLGMRNWTSGVTIVTSLSEGVRHGMTVSSFISVSLVPPLVMVSLEHGTRTHALVQRSGIFGVTILSSGQADISERFAGHLTEYSDRFDGLETFTLATGAPFLANGLASFDCRVVTAMTAGNHTLNVGEVVAMRLGPSTEPLVYFNRGYRQILLPD